MGDNSLEKNNYVLAASAAEYRFIRTGQETDAGSEKAEWGDLWSR